MKLQRALELVIELRRGMALTKAIGYVCDNYNVDHELLREYLSYHGVK